VDYKQLLSIILLIAGPLFSLEAIKALLSKGIKALSGELLKLSYWPKLILSLAYSFGFIILLQGHLLTSLPVEMQDRWAGILLTAVGKAIYDLIHDAKKQ